MPELKLYSEYSRQDVHDIFSPETRFTPSSGTWGLQGIVEIPNKPGDFVFFVTFGQHQSGHTFDEWITEEGVISWQSQPSQSFQDRRIQQFIHHNEQINAIYLFLRTKRTSNYTYLGKLKYLAHDLVREKPVYMYWQLLDWPIPAEVLRQINLNLQPASLFQQGKLQIREQIAEYDPENIDFVWQGVTWQVNRHVLISQVRDWIARGLPVEAVRFKDWYVEIDGQRISPKWLFHLITGAGYNEFDSHLAREKLARVGLKAIELRAQEGKDITARVNNAAVSLSRLRPDDRRIFFRNITEALANEFSETVATATYRFLGRENWFEIHFPKLKGFYSVRLARQFDEFAYFFPGHTKAAEILSHQLTPYITDFSEQMDCPVFVSPRFTKTWGRLGIELPPGFVKERDEQVKPEIAYARQLGRFIQVTIHTLMDLQAQQPSNKPEKYNLKNEAQPQIQLMVTRLESIRQVLNGSMVTPSDEVLCDWVHFCYDFELYREGQMLFTFVTPDQVNPWYYERTRKLARLCLMRATIKE